MLSSILPGGIGSIPAIPKRPKFQGGPVIPVVQAPAAPKFGGFHPDAVIGVDTKVVGGQMNPENTRRLFFKLRGQNKLEAHTYQTEHPLVLVREKENPEDPNAIAVYSDTNRRGEPTRKLGYVPKELAAGIAPLMDREHAFEATLTKIKPYKRNDEWFHSMEMRVEYLTKPGKAPNPRIRRQVEEAFARAQDDQQYEKVLGMATEEMHSYRLPDQKRRLIERIDNDRGEASYYLKGKLITRVPLIPGEKVEPKFVDDPEVTDAVKEKVRKRLDVLG